MSRSGQTNWITCTFQGGWMTDMGPSFYGAPAQDKTLPIPFLSTADNLIYTLDGGFGKMGGTLPLNPSPIISTTTQITALFDFWKNGTGGTPNQQRLAVAGTNVYNDNADGVFVSLGTPNLTAGATAHIGQGYDTAVICTDSTADTPKSYDQTTYGNLAGSPARMSFTEFHKNHMFGSGDFANPSRIYYTVPGAVNDWTGAGSGSIDVNPSDGDIVVGLASHMGQLIVFKGPNKGSIHILTGATNSDFALTPFIMNLGGVWQNSIFRFGNDLGWMTPQGTVHSLSTTAAFGNYTETYLSFPINQWIRDNVNQSGLRKAWATNDFTNGKALFLVPSAGNNVNDMQLLMDYRFMFRGERFPRWARWNTYKGSSMAQVMDVSSRKRIFIGGNEGQIWKTDQSNRAHNTVTPINMTALTPSMTFGSEIEMKTLHNLGVLIAPKNNNNITVSWTRGGSTPQIDTVTQGAGGDVLGPAGAGQTPFTLDTSTLGGARFVSRYLEEETGGEFRSLSIQVSDTILNSDLEVHGIGIGIAAGATSTDNNE